MKNQTQSQSPQSQSQTQTSQESQSLPYKSISGISPICQRRFTNKTDPADPTDLFTDPTDSPNPTVWVRKTARISNDRGEVIFEQPDVEAPETWSQQAVNIVASKYFLGGLGTAERESSVKQMIERVADTICRWGINGWYFGEAQTFADTRETARIAFSFKDELAYILTNQMASFNSPVWFNVGVKKHRGHGWRYDAKIGAVRRIKSDESVPQCSACFINSVKDSMESILELSKTEGMLFKWGSGTGTNFSTLRESGGRLSSGGSASGPLSFMKGLDAFAGVIKSGGTTRRSAKLAALNCDHPDVEKFIGCKSVEEAKAHALIDAGYKNSMDGEGSAYESVFYQNANNSVRVSDKFMQAVEEDSDWDLHSVVDGSVTKTLKARSLLRRMAESAWKCGDPGVQYDDTVNLWHTSKASGRINASNPCSEYVFLDDTACNLSSINLVKFLNPDGSFDTDGFKHVVGIMLLAQEILVDNSSYPTRTIAENSHRFRPLGLGFANLGSLLMRLGIPYDSVEGREWAGGITSLMTGEAYRVSAVVATELGACEGWAENEESFAEVMQRHLKAADRLRNRKARDIWRKAIGIGGETGYRNSQVTVLAPTGTISFMMDCDTTGIEPELSLVKYKKLAGGGSIQLANSTVRPALHTLGYSDEIAESILIWIAEKGTVEGCPQLKQEHVPVFDCSFRPQNGVRSIDYYAHLSMMAAVQPFLSGAISKTVNMPEEATVEEIEKVYVEGWKLGLKSVAVYRNNSKRTQPMNSGKQKEERAEVQEKRSKGDVDVDKSISTKLVDPTQTDQPTQSAQPISGPFRRRLPDERTSITHKFRVAGHKGYVTIGLYEDGTPGEMFIRMAKEGSVISGMMDAFATAVSFGLQYGVPLKFFVDKFSHARFEPSGWTGNAKVPYAKSLVDYIFRWMGQKFLGYESPEEKSLANGSNGSNGSNVTLAETTAANATTDPTLSSSPAPPVKVDPSGRGKGAASMDCPVCPSCGSLMVPNGACYKCENCGGTSGCS